MLKEAVFISDLHLHPDEQIITRRFNQFIDWAAVSTRTLYILGDFFHVWPGDDGLEPWSVAILNRLKWLSEQGVAIYFMPGNRDFLIGSHFIEQAGMTLLMEPSVVEFGSTLVLLVHGDKYCTKDRGHQWLRKLTRNRIFPKFFLKLPFRLRYKIVKGARLLSQSHRYNPDTMNVVPEAMISDMQHHQVKTLVHGHTHKPGLTKHLINDEFYRQFVLSDWDDSPQILCYDKTKGFYFIQFIPLEDL
ncbi:MAG: UDP-2,3-diacylglucosamine diphosphatase [Legionella sp.]|nr:UDP-2,3-diacylglucosamine diphosphatase [Legionella sp.]